MNLWMLDTNVCVDYFNGRQSVVDRIQRKSAEELRLSSIAIAELRFGADKSTQQEKNHQRINTLVRAIPCLPFDLDAADHYAKIRVTLTKRGKPIGPYDVLIAAHAIAANCCLVTDNVGEFSRVEELRVENWRSAS